MLRKVVTNGFKLKPDSNAFIYSNQDLLKITECQSIVFFAERQQLTRMSGARYRHEKRNATNHIIYDTQKKERQINLKSCEIRNRHESTKVLENGAR